MVINPKRYDIYIAELNPTIGSELNKKRPVVIISLNAMNTFLETVVVCPLTTKIHPKWRSRIQIICAGQEAEIVVDQIRTISKLRLYKKIDSLSIQKAQELRQIIHEMYAAA